MYGIILDTEKIVEKKNKIEPIYKQMHNWEMNVSEEHS